MLGLPLTCDGLRTANRLTAPAGTIEHVLPSWLNSAAGNLTAANRMVEFDRGRVETSNLRDQRHVSTLGSVWDSRSRAMRDCGG